MATLKQRRAIDKIVESHGKISMGKAMRDAGYKPASAKNPKNLTDSIAYQENFNVPKAKETVGNILLNGQEGNKLKAAQEIFKVEGAYAPDKNLNVNINQNIPDEQVDRLADELIKRLKDGETTDNKGTSNSKGGK